MAVKRKKKNPIFEQAKQRGFEEGMERASVAFAGFLNERMATLTEIKGIGEKTAWKVQEHFIQYLDEQENKTH